MDKYIYHGLKLAFNEKGGIAFENPAIEFTKKAKNGEFDSLSDKQYYEKLDAVIMINDLLFHETPYVPPYIAFKFFATQRINNNKDDKTFDEIFNNEWSIFTEVLKNFLQDTLKSKSVFDIDTIFDDINTTVDEDKNNDEHQFNGYTEDREDLPYENS